MSYMENQNETLNVNEIDLVKEETTLINEVELIKDEVTQLNEINLIKNETKSTVAEVDDDDDFDDDESVEGVFIYKLRTPIVYDGKKVEELMFDFDKLPSSAMFRASREAKAILKQNSGKKAQLAIVPEMDKTYLACIAAMAAGVSSDLIFNLTLKDLTTITVRTQNFLLQD